MERANKLRERVDELERELGETKYALAVAEAEAEATMENTEDRAPTQRNMIINMISGNSGRLNLCQFHCIKVTIGDDVRLNKLANICTQARAVSPGKRRFSMIRGGEEILLSDDKHLWDVPSDVTQLYLCTY